MVALYLCYAGIGGMFVGLAAAVVHQWNVFQEEMRYPLEGAQAERPLTDN